MRSPYYCNINGKFGLGAYEKPDFPALSDLLAHMDRLGVWQTVAYHSNARDLHPVFGNRFLMEDIAKTREVLDNFQTYALKGGMLLVEGQIAGFSLGEVLGDTLFIHVEKAQIGFYDDLIHALICRTVDKGKNHKAHSRQHKQQIDHEPVSL